jgi:cytochrome c oxidase assembly protein subunit 15
MQQPPRSLLWLACGTLLLCFGVVVLGAYVRLSAAGLGCPDWPGCYGHVSPIGAAANAIDSSARFGGQIVEVGKAWREMIHRYAAGALGFLIVVIAALAIQYRREYWSPLRLALGLVALVVAQGMLGALTVTWRLKPLIVSAHLLFGLATLSLLWCLVLVLGRQSPSGSDGAANAASAPLGAPAAAPLGARRAALLALCVLIAQIALGGWTSSNYAATACPDFPLCQNAWLPAAQYDQAFVLWRGLGVNYEGGVLDLAARVAIHFTHRLGAVVATLALLYACAWSLRRRTFAPATARQAAAWVLGALALQLLIGVSMVLKSFPLWLATAHNAGAALLLLSVVALNVRLRNRGVHP